MKQESERSLVVLLLCGTEIYLGVFSWHLFGDKEAFRAVLAVSFWQSCPLQP